MRYALAAMYSSTLPDLGRNLYLCKNRVVVQNVLAERAPTDDPYVTQLVEIGKSISLWAVAPFVTAQHKI